MRTKWFVLILLFLVFGFDQSAFARDVNTIHVAAGFSTPLQLPEAASTIAIGNQGIIATNTLKPDLIMINGQATGATSVTVFGRSGKIYEYRVQVGNDIYQLRSMINAIEKHVTVEDLNGIIVLKGTVPNPTALVRVLTIADRYVTGSGAKPDFSVISDRGGVLSGNLDEEQTGVDEEIAGVSPDPRVAIPQVQVGRGGGGGGGGAGGGGGGGGGRNALARTFRQPLMPIKGNLAQNISRGEVVMVGGGKVMSMIQVAKQPKVEIQMQIIAVDRNKTDEFGIDWRLDRISGGKRVIVGSTLGDVSASGGDSPTQIADAFTPGDSSVFGIFNTGKYFLSTFLKFLQQKGAAKTLSNPLVTAISGESASFLVGGNVPIPFQTAVAGSLGGGAAVATNVRFIQFGLKLIVRPTVLENGKISIVLDQIISEPDYSQAITIIGAQVPGFTQRSISTVTESASGESWAVAGLLSEENAKNLDQVPWLSRIPVLGYLFQKKTDSKTRNELMILVNARVIDGDNNTTTSFNGKGDMAPTDQPVSEESDLPVPEEAPRDSPMANPATSNVGPARSNKSRSERSGSRPKISLPEVIVPPEVRGPDKPTTDSDAEQMPLTLYLNKDQVDKNQRDTDASTNSLPVVTYSHPAIPKTPENSAGTQLSGAVPNSNTGKLIFYKEFETAQEKTLDALNNHDPAKNSPQQHLADLNAVAVKKQPSPPDQPTNSLTTFVNNVLTKTNYKAQRKIVKQQQTTAEERVATAENKVSTEEAALLLQGLEKQQPIPIPEAPVNLPETSVDALSYNVSDLEF